RLIREKEEHISQLLEERDIERSDLAKATLEREQSEKMCSVDMQLVFANVRLHEAVDFVCALSELGSFLLPIATGFLKQLLLCTEKVTSMFLNSAYQQ
ncbi:hypothetical protein T265_15882, partial [Opisthorchis viverrini]